MSVAAGFMHNAPGLQPRITRVVNQLTPSRSKDFCISLFPPSRMGFVVFLGAVVQAALVATGLLAGRIPGAGLPVVLVFLLVLVQPDPSLILLPCVVHAWVTRGSLGALIFSIWKLFPGPPDKLLTPLWMGKGLPVPFLLRCSRGDRQNGAHWRCGPYLGPVVLALGSDLLRNRVRDPLRETAAKLLEE